MFIIASNLHKGMFVKMVGNDLTWYAIKSKATQYSTTTEAQSVINERKLNALVVAI